MRAKLVKELLFEYGAKKPTKNDMHLKELKNKLKLAEDDEKSQIQNEIDVVENKIIQHKLNIQKSSEMKHDRAERKYMSDNQRRSITR